MRAIKGFFAARSCRYCLSREDVRRSLVTGIVGAFLTFLLSVLGSMLPLHFPNYSSLIVGVIAVLEEIVRRYLSNSEHSHSSGVAD